MNDASTLPGLSLEQEIEAAKALFAHPPTLREVALSAIQEAFFSRWDPQRNASHLYVGKLLWREQEGKRFSGGYQYRAVIDLVLEHFTSGVAPLFTAEHVLEIRLDGLPGDRLVVDAAATQATLGSWGDILLQLYQQGLVDYWNAEDADGSSRFQRLGRILMRMFSADREQHRAFLSIDLQKPEQQLAFHGIQAVSKDIWGGSYPEALPVLVARRKERGIEQNPLLLSLAKGLFRADTTDLGPLLPLFMSVRANGRDIEYREHRLWQRGDPDMQLGLAFASFVETLLENQLQAIALIGFDSEWTLADYQHRLDEITRPDDWFFTPVQTEPHTVVELPEALAALNDGLPHWLLGASSEDLGTYRALLEKLAEVQRVSGGKAFLDDVGDLPEFAARALRKKMGEDHPSAADIANPDDIRLELDKVIAVAVAGGAGGALGTVEKVRMSLTEFALENLGGFRHAKMKITIRHCGVDVAVPDWLTADYVKALVTAVDIGKTYLDILRAKLVDDADEVRRRETLFTGQLRVQLPMAALELKIRGDAHFDEAGYRCVEAVVQAEAAQRQVNGQEIVLRPLAFKAEADASADVVASMFIIGPKDTGSGPFILYRPLLAKAGPQAAAFQQFQATADKHFCPHDNDARPTPPVEPLLQYPTWSALFDALRQPGSVQDSILAWLSDQARRTYANGGLVEPHLRRSFEDDFAVLLPVAPATLDETVVRGDYLHHLFDSLARTLIALADRQSVSNAELRWNTLKEGGWQLFNVVLMFIRGPAAVAGWIFAVVASVDADFRRLQEKDPGAKANAWADVLVNIAFILEHHLNRRQAHARTPQRIPLDEGQRPSHEATISEGPDRPLPMKLDNPVAPGTVASRPTASSFTLKIYPYPWPAPETLGEVIASGDLKGLIRLKESKRVAAYFGGWLFAVKADSEGTVQVVSPDGLRDGFYLKNDGAGVWTPDLKLRLRGGSGRPGNVGKRRAALLEEKRREQEQRERVSERFMEGWNQRVAEQGRRARALFPEREALVAMEANPDRYTHAQWFARMDRIAELGKALIDGYEQQLNELRMNETVFLRGYKATLFTTLDQFVTAMQFALDAIRIIDRRCVRIIERLPYQDGSGRVLMETQRLEQRENRATDLYIDWAEREQQAFAELGDHRNQNLADYQRMQQIRGGGHKVRALKAIRACRLAVYCFRELDPHQLESDISTKLNDLRGALASQSILDERSATPLSAEADIAVLNTCVSQYNEALAMAEYKTGLLPPGTRLVWTDLFTQRLVELQQEAERSLVARIEAQAPTEDAPDLPSPPAGKRRKIIRTRRKQHYLGYVRDTPQDGHEVVELMDPQTGQPLESFVEEEDGYWQPLPKPAPAPAPRPAPQPGLKRLVQMAESQIRQAGREIEMARRQIPVAKDPIYLQDVLDVRARALEALAGQIDRAVTQANGSVTQSEVSAGQVQAAELRLQAGTLRHEGLMARIAVTKSSAPDTERLLFLKEHNEVEIFRNGPRTRLGKSDFLQEYAVRDKATGKNIWVAHFHYPDKATPEELFVMRGALDKDGKPQAHGAHLKRWAERFLGIKAQARAEQERFERIRQGQPGRALEVFRIWRSEISLVMARQLFFNAPEREVVVREQLRQL
ncbi:dermonecrotic toxin domain-containing protein [Pseudomonas gingeri]